MRGASLAAGLLATTVFGGVVLGAISSKARYKVHLASLESKAKLEGCDPLYDKYQDLGSKYILPAACPFFDSEGKRITAFDADGRQIQTYVKEFVEDKDFK